MFQANEPVAFCDQFRFFIDLFPPWKGFSSGESIYRAGPSANRHTIPWNPDYAEAGER